MTFVRLAVVLAEKIDGAVGTCDITANSWSGPHVLCQNSPQELAEDHVLDVGDS